MKVAVVSNTAQERCGNKEYGINLTNQLAKRFNVTLMSQAPEERFDAVVFNWHSAVVWCSVQEIRRLKEMGTKVALIIQESSAQTQPDGMFIEADVVTAHEHMDFGSAPIKFRLVQHGMPEVDSLPGWDGTGPLVGAAGFPFPAKRMDMAVRMATTIGGSALVVAPAHSWRDPTDLYEQWRQLGSVDILTDWLSQEDVARKLSTCMMIAHMADDGVIGQSGSVGLVLAARRPTIVRRTRKVKFLEPYADEVYLVNSDAEALSAARQIATNPASAKVPNRLIAELSWNYVGSQYCDIIEELVGKEVSA